MVEVAYLAIGEQPPAGERFILDRALSPWGQNYRRALPQGHPGECACAFPASEISAFSRMVDEAGITKLYVKGATDHAQTERAAALSW